jgi:hypothetical protein
MAIFITFSEVWEAGRNPCLFFKRTSMKRSEVVNFMMNSLKEYYEANASENGAAMIEGLSFILSKLEEEGIVSIDFEEEK